jgi:hypothetical protein
MTFGTLLLSFLLLAVSQGPTCPDASGCRQAALEAAARQEYETFHDLAWRAVQQGKRNDPELMYLLARAQSLSGRPGDALVMLRRLASLGVATDAREHEDFRSVRRLSGWPEVEALIGAASVSPLTSEPLPPEPAGKPAANGLASADDLAATAPEAAAARTNPAPPRAMPPPARSPVTRGEAARRLPAGVIEPAGLAYDSASRRFVLADRRLNRLVVADEVFDQVSDLIGATAGGFGALTALAIDSRRGDLWVTSAGSAGAAAIHKLQLVSGRVLSSLDLPHEWRPATFIDLAVTDTGTLLLLDSAGSRLLTLRANARTFDRTITLDLANPSSVTADSARAYIAHDAGVAIADLTTGRVSVLQAPSGVSLSGLQRIRWHAGSLVGIQRLPDVGDRLVRIRLARGGAAAVDVLDDDPALGGSALTLSRDAAYYLAEDDGVQVIRRVPLQ